MVVRVACATLAVAAGVYFTRGEASASERPCTLIGCESGVLVTLDRVPVGAAIVEVCVDGRCRRVRTGSLSRLVFVPVDEPDTQPATVLVRIRALARRGRVIFTRSRPVPLREVRPNGGDCPPVCYQCAIRLVGDRVRIAT